MSGAGDRERRAQTSSLRFVRVPDAAKRLTPLQRDVLFGLLGYCRHAPFCWPGQRRLARDLGRSLGMVNQGIRELVELGAISKRVQPGRQSCIYEIATEFWIPCKRSSAAATAGFSLGTCSAGRTESDSTVKKKTPPGGPRDDAGAPPPDLVQQVEGQGAGIDGEAIEAAPRPPSSDDQPAPFGHCQRCGAVRHAPAPAACPQCGSTRRTPYKQPRAPRAPRKPRRRWRRRNDFLVAAERIDAQRARAEGRAPPIVLPAEPQIISPAEWQRRQQRQPRHPFLEAADAIERKRRGEQPIFDPAPLILIEWTFA